MIGYALLVNLFSFKASKLLRLYRKSTKNDNSISSILNCFVADVCVNPIGDPLELKLLCPLLLIPVPVTSLLRSPRNCSWIE